MAQLRGTVTPGRAEATQTPFAVPPTGTRSGGFDFGTLLSRQMALRDQMAQAELDYLQQQMYLESEAAKREKLDWQAGREAATKKGFGRRRDPDPGSEITQLAMTLGTAAAGGLKGSPHVVAPRTNEQILAYGLPLAMKYLGGGGSGAGAVTFPEEEGMSLGQARAKGLEYSPQLTTEQEYETAEGKGKEKTYEYGWQPKYTGSGLSAARSMEKGGRVPKTGTYKLHKGEIVIPKKAADVMRAYAHGPKGQITARARPGAKPIKSYQQGTGAPLSPTAALMQYGGPGTPGRFFKGMLPGGAQRAMGQPAAPATRPPMVLPPGIRGAPTQQRELPPMEPPAAMPTEDWIEYGGGKKKVPKYKRDLDDKIYESERRAKEDREKADYEIARANILQTYKDAQGRVPQEIGDMIKDRQQSAAYWDKQAETETKKAESFRTEKMHRDLAGFEAEMEAASARLRTRGDEAKEYDKEFKEVWKGISKQVETFSKEDIDEEAFATNIKTIVGPYIASYAKAGGESIEEVTRDLNKILSEQDMTRLSIMVQNLVAGRYGG